MDGTATINAKVDTLATVRIVQNLGCAKPRLLGYIADSSVAACAAAALSSSSMRDDVDSSRPTFAPSPYPGAGAVALHLRLEFPGAQIFFQLSLNNCCSSNSSSSSSRTRSHDVRARLRRWPRKPSRR